MGAISLAAFAGYADRPLALRYVLDASAAGGAFEANAGRAAVSRVVAFKSCGTLMPARAFLLSDSGVMSAADVLHVGFIPAALWCCSGSAALVSAVGAERWSGSILNLTTDVGCPASSTFQLLEWEKRAGLGKASRP